MNWSDPENLRLGPTEELIARLDSELGNPQAKPTLDERVWCATSPADFNYTVIQLNPYGRGQLA